MIEFFSDGFFENVILMTKVSCYYYYFYFKSYKQIIIKKSTIFKLFKKKRIKIIQIIYKKKLWAFKNS